MDNSELKQTAIGILSNNHWPAHLGLNTETERIEWLARQVETLTDELDRFDGVDDCDDCDLCSAHQA